MNTDIRLQVSFFMHHKTLKLESILGEGGPLRLIQLWTWVAMNKPDGNLKGMQPDEVELAAGWRGNSGVLIDTLITCKFIDGTPGTYKVHDWEEHNPYAASSGDRIIRAVKANATRAANDLGLEGDEREKFIAKRIAKRTAKRTAKSKPPSPAPSPAPPPAPSPAPSPTVKTAKPDLPGWCTDLVKELFPKLKTGDIQKQAETIEQLFRLDSYTQEDIEQVLRWAKTDTGNGSWAGWSAQFLSCGPLRIAKKKGDVHKFAKMKAGFQSSGTGIEEDFYKDDVDF